MNAFLRTFGFALFTLSAISAAPAEEKAPIIIDTDFGAEVDDAFALALAVSSEKIDLRGVTTVGSEARARALMVCRFLSAVDRKDVPVAFGRDPQPEVKLGLMSQYQNHPAVIFGRMAQPVKEPAVEWMYQKLKADQGKITIVALGPLTNVARLLEEHPDCKPWIKQIAVGDSAGGKNADGVRFGEGIRVVSFGTLRGKNRNVMPAEDLWKWIFSASTPLTLQLQALYQLSHGGDVPWGDIRLLRGTFYEKVGSSHEESLNWYAGLVAAGEPALPREPVNVSTPIEHGGFPNRVHACEDYETEIEKRWWMAGRLEEKNVPPGSRRACRGVLTQDFDDKMGDLKTMYTAVIFNPVPGPPMGKHPRLAFRCHLKGASTLRVQIYSLSNGYHRCLTLTDLAQEKWLDLTVDMTKARKPDGSGGPLSEDERIDDIQFYADPRAELLIDDIVLYDAYQPEAQARENLASAKNRAFPKRFLFTGWFDTGVQGKEWPGKYEILEKKGYFWDAARSVDNPDLGGPAIRLNLRGMRPLGERTELFFRHKLTGGDSVRIRLYNTATKSGPVVELKDLKQGDWVEATVDLSEALADFNRSQTEAARIDRVDEIHVLPSPGADLLIDDLLLYEPGKS